MTWKHSNRRLQNEEEVEEKYRVLRKCQRKKFQVRARRVKVPLPRSSSRERQPKMSGRKKLLLRGNVPIQAAFPTGTKTTKDHVTEVVFSQRVYIVYIKSVCFRVQVFKSVCFLTVISMIRTY